MAMDGPSWAEMHRSNCGSWSKRSRARPSSSMEPNDWAVSLNTIFIRSGCRDGGLWLPPFPRQKLVELGCRVVVDPAEHVGEPRFWIDVVELGRCDQGVDRRGPSATPIRAAEGPVPPPDRDTAQRALGRIVGQADAAVFEEVCKGWPALQHVVNRLGDVVVTRELGALGAHPVF